MVRRLLERLFFPVGTLASLALIAAVYVLFDTEIAIRGSYVAIGLAVAAGIYYRYSGSEGGADPHPTGRSDYLYPKLVFIAVASGVVGTVLIGNRAVWVFLALLVGFSLFMIQFVRGTSSHVLLPQLFALFGLPPLTKYLSHGFYFGNSDTLFHVRNIEDLLRTGTPTAFGGMGAQYQWFPGFHILTSAISMFTGIGPYDAILTLGILTYSIFLISLVYLLARRTTGDPGLSLSITLGVAGVHTFSFTSTYFFPQAFSLFPLVLLIYLVYRIADSTWKREAGAFSLIAVLVLLALTFTHHLSFIFFAPVIVFLALNSASSKTLIPLSVRNPSRATSMLFLLLLVPVSYWAYRADFFIAAVVVEMIAALENSQLIGQAGNNPDALVLTYGDVSVREGTEWALRAMSSPDGIYLTLLMAVFAIGAVLVVTPREWWRRRVPLEFAMIGLFASAVVFKTPYSFHYVVRFRYSMAVFFVFVVGFGIYYTVISTRTGLTESGSSFVQRARAVLPVIVVVGLLVVTPLQPIAGDDLYGLFPLRQKQVEYTEQEYGSAAEAAAFVETYDGDLTTLWIDRSTLERFRVNAPGRINATEERIRVSTDLFMYRNRWPNHVVLFRSEGRQLDEIVFDRRWLEYQVSTQNKVYSTGEHGMLWGEPYMEFRADAMSSSGS